jgi:allantoinase
VGKDADVVLLDPQRYAFDPARSLSAVQWSSFEGREFLVRVAATWCRGQRVYDGEHIVNPAGSGRFLRPHRPHPPRA